MIAVVVEAIAVDAVVVAGTVVVSEVVVVPGVVAPTVVAPTVVASTGAANHNAAAIPAITPRSRSTAEVSPPRRRFAPELLRYVRGDADQQRPGRQRCRPPLRGNALVGHSGLELLVADDPPFVLDVDTGRTARVTGVPVRKRPVLSVLAVGRDAVLWVDRASARGFPRAEIYVLRHGARTATRLATAWAVAPSADGRAVWLKSFTDARRCTLRELRLDGHERGSPHPVPCSARLIDTGAGALLVDGSSAVDPSSGRTLVRAGAVWAQAGRFVLTSRRSHGSLALTDLRSGRQRWLPWPSKVGGPMSQGGIDQAAVEPNGRLIALSFSDPAWQGSGTQITDVWILDPTNRRFRHLPGMPAAVALKFTSMSWTTDGRLVILAETSGQDVVAVWRPGRPRLALRRVALPERDSGSDSFVVWSGG